MAERVGYPVMIKASEGGGGKGVRKATEKSQIPSMYQQVADEVKGSPVFLMRLCTGARHVEIQVLADKHRALALTPTPAFSRMHVECDPSLHARQATSPSFQGETVRCSGASRKLLRRARLLRSPPIPCATWNSLLQSSH